ncbi:hypothetical protein IV38_GL000878 [Lactobacillus selangorensis]|uniref:HTH merR-type domain-containing protein n=1 Tax=Lactobacillus selangorensis TaxID=81857 RepID=A0A0R2FJ81_9LACO|nr:MerR family transcriptional regulator [Lactobacillus selangorensis]KRN28675.1 hypothetical protein IV38_GL000878 [Lactobacillus selangorensis]KRN32915.1 hypothetical protein IV40_GL000975 [Lactobacillus selangorensis]
MNIQAVSKKYGVSSDTLRYWERVGVIPPVTRNASGYRDYTPEDENWVHFTQCMRNAGVSIDILIEYTTLMMEGKQTIAARQSLLEEQRDKLQDQIDKLAAARDRLNGKLDGYAERMANLDESKYRKTK